MPTLLVVDDEPMVRSLVVSAMERRGWSVVSMADVASALQVVARRDVDLVLADIILPGRSGLELAEALQTAAPELPVLFMSGHPERFQFPVTPLPCWGTPPEVLAKPFTVSELHDTVTRMAGAAGAPKCSQCGSASLTFIEHTQAGRLVRCTDCGRAVVMRGITDRVLARAAREQAAATSA